MRDERDQRERRELWPLRGAGNRRILLELHGVEHPVHPTGPGRAFARYEDITYLEVSERGLWLGTRRDALLIPRSTFEEREGPEDAEREILGRIEAGPGGAPQLERMRRVVAEAQRHGPLRATWGLVALCLAVYVVQLVLPDAVHQVGNFSGPLYSTGDYWRVVTANFLHAPPDPFYLVAHLLLNLVGVVAVGSLCEHILGSRRTIAVMGASGLLAMLACNWFQYPQVVGASGILAGLVGSLAWLECFRTEDLPAWRRLPRRPLAIVLAATVVVDWFVPALAGAAHIGGFVGGAAMTWLVSGRPAGRRPVPLFVGALAVLVPVGVLAMGVKAGVELATTEDYAARNLLRYIDMPDVSADELNNIAWLVATERDSRALHESALIIAERAVELSERKSPMILDTLAEVHFVLGDAELAIHAIDEALALEPDDEYYQEQRLRFLGEGSEEDPVEGSEAPGDDAPAEPATE